MLWLKDLKKSVGSSPKYRMLYIFSDGALRLRPPAAATAVVIKNERGQVLDWYSRVLPPVSSVEAEYWGILDALALATKLCPLGLKRACFHLDNQVVVGQVAGRYSVRGAKLKPLHAQAMEAVTRLQAAGCSEIEFYHVPREFNLLADALAADALLIMPSTFKQNMAVATSPGSETSKSN